MIIKNTDFIYSLYNQLGIYQTLIKSILSYYE